MAGNYQYSSGSNSERYNVLVVMSSNLLGKYQIFGENYCLHLQERMRSRGSLPTPLQSLLYWPYLLYPLNVFILLYALYIPYRSLAHTFFATNISSTVCPRVKRQFFASPPLMISPLANLIILPYTGSISSNDVLTKYLENEDSYYFETW
jgi:hypothetical protein